MISLKFYRTHPHVLTPAFLTSQSACFDISFSSAGKQRYEGYNKQNKKIDRPMSNGTVHLMPGDRIMVPTGLILDIPAGYSVRIHPRSGLSLKQGLVLANCEGVIDSDYVNELYILMHNTSENGITINNGDRIAQGELVEQVNYTLDATLDKPGQKTERIGGMGSTGINAISITPTSDIIRYSVNATVINASNVNSVSITSNKRGRGRPKKVETTT